MASKKIKLMPHQQRAFEELEQAKDRVLLLPVSSKTVTFVDVYSIRYSPSDQEDDGEYDD